MGGNGGKLVENGEKRVKMDKNGEKVTELG